MTDEEYYRYRINPYFYEREARKHKRTHGVLRKADRVVKTVKGGLGSGAHRKYEDEDLDIDHHPRRRILRRRRRWHHDDNWREEDSSDGEEDDKDKNGEPRSDRKFNIERDEPKSEEQ